MTSKPKYDTSNRTRTKLTDEIIDKINELLLQNEKIDSLVEPSS